MNIQRNASYIKLLHCIKSCVNYKQVDTLLLHVLDYANNHEDGNDLLLEFQTKKTNLTPLMEDEMMPTIIDNPRFNIRLNQQSI